MCKLDCTAAYNFLYVTGCLLQSIIQIPYHPLDSRRQFQVSNKLGKVKTKNTRAFLGCILIRTDTILEMFHLKQLMSFFNLFQ